MSVTTVSQAEIAVNEARRMSQEIIQQKPAKISDHSVSYGGGYCCHHNYYGWPGYGWGPNYYFSPPAHYNSSSCNKDKDEWRGTVGLLGAAVALVTTYFIGRDWGTRSNAVADITRLEDRQKWVNKEMQANHTDQWEAQKVSRVMDKQKGMIQMIKSDANCGLTTKGGLALSSVVCVGAALYDTWNIAQFGIAGACLFGIGMLFRAGMNDTSNHLRREAQDIEAIARTIRFEKRTDASSAA